MKPLAHLFIDFENRQPAAEHFKRVQELQHVECHVWLFHGPHQNKFAADVVAAWQPLGERVRFVQTSRPGKDALDFHVAFALGRAMQEDAASQRRCAYAVVSQDNGFDALFDHMRSLGAAVAKGETIEAALAAALGALTGQAGKKAPVVRAPQRETTSPEDVASVIDSLRAHPANRPKDREALARYMAPVLRHRVSPGACAAIVDELERRGVIAHGEKVLEYRFPPA